MARSSDVAQPCAAVEIADSLTQIRQLIQLADLQMERVRNDLGVARVALADIEEELITRGLAK